MAGREVTIYWVGSPKFTAGHPAPLIALVHHRMVGTLRSTDSAFTSTDGREARPTSASGTAATDEDEWERWAQPTPSD